MAKQFQVNKKYTHFATVKTTGKIVNGWEYKNYNQSELNAEKKYYFFNDLSDNDINIKLIKIQTAKQLQKIGINPFDWSNWHNNKIDGTAIYNY